MVSSIVPYMLKTEDNASGTQQSVFDGMSKATLECAKSFATTDFRHDLAAFNVPTLVIHGTADQTVPIDASGRAAAAGIAGATLFEYEGAPHGLFATDKAQLTWDLLAFLSV